MATEKDIREILAELAKEEPEEFGSRSITYISDLKLDPDDIGTAAEDPDVDALIRFAALATGCPIGSEEARSAALNWAMAALTLDKAFKAGAKWLEAKLKAESPDAIVTSRCVVDSDRPHLLSARFTLLATRPLSPTDKSREGSSFVARVALDEPSRAAELAKSPAEVEIGITRTPKPWSLLGPDNGIQERMPLKAALNRMAELLKGIAE